MSNSVENFLRERGTSLEPYGSAEVGLHVPDVLELLDLLILQSIPVHGIEQWRYANNRYSIESLGGWHSDGNDLQANYTCAKSFVTVANMSPNDLMTVQFSGMTLNRSFHKDAAQ